MPMINIEDRRNNRGLPIPPLFQLLTLLRFYGTSNFQIVNGDLRRIHQSTVSRIITRLSKIMASNAKHHVHFPRNVDEWKVVQVKFYKMYKMPGIGGCIDCTHIKIQNPGGPDLEAFRNRKGYFSLNVQAVYCGPSMEFMDIVVRWPGSYHDSFIFSSSYANKYFDERTHNMLLLGDGGYACKTYLFTPLRNPVTPPELKYNKAQIRTRNIIERVFGVWKRKFPCLQRGLANAPSTIVNIIIACAMLHNISRKYQNADDDSDDEEDILEEEYGEYNDDNNILGPAARSAYIVRHFS
ncbi:unnamed protein product [Macrosiphum euphorbiae]|uniref:DDE Tnp4 domain-containing protein n=2 Tax=Macrosiphum euphorbiae TaxID=13131 RepID=A0AAV0YA73_9HEMI|nr:unnamed protein product [Macrosiphum euphorbiae]